MGSSVMRSERGAVLVGRVGEAVKETHHLLPRQFIKEFEAAGLDIERFKIPMSKAEHTLKPNGIHTGSASWNKVWGEFFDKYKRLNRAPEYKDILNQLKYMRKRFRI